MSQEEMFDGLYMNVAQRAQGIDGIFDSFFGFLQRKTDFFQGASSKDAAEKFVLKAFNKQWEIREKKMDEDKKRYERTQKNSEVQRTIFIIWKTQF